MAKSTAARDAFKDRFDAMVREGGLPEGTKATFAGPITLRVMNEIDWERPDELNAALSERVIAVFRRILAESEPLLDTDA